MYAIEFQATIKDGVIEIPQEYQDQVKQHVKVILLVDEHPPAADMIGQLLTQPLEIADFMPLSRDAAHERQ